jgi:hypothetical protein
MPLPGHGAEASVALARTRHAGEAAERFAPGRNLMTIWRDGCETGPATRAGDRARLAASRRTLLRLLRLAGRAPGSVLVDLRRPENWRRWAARRFQRSRRLDLAERGSSSARRRLLVQDSHGLVTLADEAAEEGRVGGAAGRAPAAGTIGQEFAARGAAHSWPGGEMRTATAVRW